jgi:hypothetical protein
MLRVATALLKWYHQDNDDDAISTEMIVIRIIRSNSPTSRTWAIKYWSEFVAHVAIFRGDLNICLNQSSMDHVARTRMASLLHMIHKEIGWLS